MKALKVLTVITGIMFLAGLLMVLGQVGNADLEGNLSIIMIILGILIMIPFPLVGMVIYEGKII